MNADVIRNRDFERELLFSASRSSGPGGQNVNKVNTRVELRFHIAESLLLDENEKQLLVQRLASRITSEGYLIIACQTERSQYENRIKATERFYDLLSKGLKPVKKRIPTKPNTASRLKRLDSKKLNSRKKNLRRSVEDL